MQLQRDNLLKAVSIKIISTKIEDLAKGNTTVSRGTLYAQVHHGQGQRIELSHPFAQQSSNSVNIKTIRDRVRIRVDRAVEDLGMEDTDGDTDTESEQRNQRITSRGKQKKPGKVKTVMNKNLRKSRFLAK